MARPKRGKHGGGKKATPPNRRGGPARAADIVRGSDLDLDDTRDTPMQQFRGFSMRGEIKKTGNLSVPRNGDFKLRHQAIAFVSATPVENATPVEQDKLAVHRETVPKVRQGVAESKLDISEDAMAQMSIRSSAEASSRDSEDRDSDVEMHAGDDLLQTDRSADALAFVVDTVGYPALALSIKASGKRPVVREPSPTPSDSSQEIVLFQGRNRAPAVIDRVEIASSEPQPKLPPHVRAAQESSRSPQRTQGNSQTREPHITDALMAALDAIDPPQRLSTPLQQQEQSAASSFQTPLAETTSGWASALPARQTQLQEPSDWTPAPPGAWWRKKKPEQDAPIAQETIDILRKEARKELKEHKKKKLQSRLMDGANESSNGLSSNLLNAGRAEVKSKHGEAVVLAEDDSEDLDDALDEILIESKGSRRRKRGRKKQNRHLAEAASENGDEAEEAAYVDYMENIRRQLDEDTDETSQAGTPATGPGLEAKMQSKQQISTAGDEDELVPDDRSQHMHRRMEGDAGRDSEINAFTTNLRVGGPSLMVDGEVVADDECFNPKLQVLHQSSSDSDVRIGLDYDEVYGSPWTDSEKDSSELEDELEYTEREQWEDEEDLRQRRQDAMTDEQIARLLAKQEELGITGDQLMIDDGDFVPTSDGAGDVDAARTGLATLVVRGNGSSTNKQSMRRRMGKPSEGFFPSATLTADVLEQDPYGGFDVMDFDRPSLRPKTKGRKGKLPPELDALSDDDFKFGMAATWSNDRDKKRVKKAEREALRIAGLLGTPGRKGRADLEVKYFDGMSLRQVHDELRTFMDSDLQERAFPPMGKTDRKALHEVCAALGLKSKSQGTGKNRFPIVFKSGLTPQYSDALWQGVMVRAQKGLLKNHFGKGAAKRGNKFSNAPNISKGAGRGGGSSTSAVRYRDGDVVGNGAAELGRENFGHRLMEKMGWTKGTALGKDGDGIKVPVTHVVKITKSGLG